LCTILLIKYNEDAAAEMLETRTNGFAEGETERFTEMANAAEEIASRMTNTTVRRGNLKGVPMN